MLLNPGSVLGDRYEIIEKIGSGGMAVVYRGKDKKLDRYVTIKVLREEFIGNEEFIERFRSEACSAARLSHPNIVRVYDVGEDGDINYIVIGIHSWGYAENSHSKESTFRFPFHH